MTFHEYGRDMFWVIRNEKPIYLIDLNVDETGVPVCTCPDFEFRRKKYADQGLIDPCKHILRLKEQLKKERK